MSFKKIIWLSLIALVVQSCTEDFFSKTIELEGEWEGPQMVIEARLDANDDSLSIFLHRSKPVFGLEDDRVDHIIGADVRLSGSDGSEYVFSFDSLRVYNRNYFAVAEPPLRAGVNYTLEIDHPDFETVATEATMPGKPVLLNYEWDKNYRLEVLDSIPYTLLELNYQDKNSAYISHIFEYGYSTGSDTLAGTMNFTSDRFDVSGFSLHNENFDVISNTSGNQASLLFEIRSRDIDEVKERPGAHLILFTQSITEDDYLFHKSVHDHTEAGNVPFVEPVIVYKDIENASGIFSLINTQKFTLPFPD